MKKTLDCHNLFSEVLNGALRFFLIILNKLFLLLLSYVVVRFDILRLYLGKLETEHISVSEACGLTYLTKHGRLAGILVVKICVAVLLLQNEAA